MLCYLPEGKCFKNVFVSPWAVTVLFGKIIKIFRKIRKNCTPFKQRIKLITSITFSIFLEKFSVLSPWEVWNFELLRKTGFKKSLEIEMYKQLAIFQHEIWKIHHFLPLRMGQYSAPILGEWWPCGVLQYAVLYFCTYK